MADKKLSVDEQIDKLLEDNNISKFEDTGYYGVVPNKIEDKIKSLIRQVCEEVINRAKLVTGTQFEWGNFRSEDDMKRELNKMLGSEK